MSRPTLTRRAILGSAAALPLAAMTTPARAAAPMLGASTTRYNRVTLGDFEVTTLLVATTARPDPQTIFGLNVSAEEFAAVSAANNIPTDQAQFFFTPTVINTGAELVLFDTGLNPDAITSALAAAGYTPDQVDVVVLTHMHGDHIGGLMGESGATFPNARYVTASAEYDHWAAAGNEGFDSKMRPLAEKTEMIGDGASVASGITAMSAAGHTPGHTAYMIESGGKSLVIAADFANHYVWSLGYPDWEVTFDMDKAQAAATRRKVLGMLAADKVPFIGYHMPFPAVGYVETRGDGFQYVPASYQLML
ncbi:putative quorum-quenching lactonase YtnP [Roseovarius sp. EC-HK134]|uniref:MBL fold metallo-hydrolase n=1 Tax=unclassified Roseovarius TaxID=2614913 RepID=UPI00125148A0|nr:MULTISPECIES: MBL fold metallo-hydrolase [unclassified Roseovarius]VVT24354.1 putative quorum-quenching lactonase YtnP [Roseovarius sp. EC-SD190]VVT24588.1 putative quorum-quenching lactonase YtnP [Roseovarius sp. EC-HK134]